MQRSFRKLRQFWRIGTSDTTSLRPDQPFFAIGDLHGCANSLLAELLAQLDDRDPNCPLVFLGDYIDRGENSAGILDMLIDLCDSYKREVVCLRGNHEQMLLDFLASPAKHGLAWMTAGGLQTLVSYGLKPPSSLPALRAASMVDIRDALASRLNERVRKWLMDRPSYWVSGNIVASHSGRDENAGLREQDLGALVCRDRNHALTAGSDIWSVEGHLIVQQPEIRGQRVLVDTGAYATSKLSAAYIAAGNIRFYSTRGT